MADGSAFVQVTAEALRADPARALRLAMLTMSAQPLFYEIFQVERGAMVEAMAAQLAEPGFDAELVFVLRRDDGADLAVITGLPLAALPSAQIASTAALLKQVAAAQRKAVMTRLRAYSAGIEPIDDSGHYVSRVAVAPESRGQGLGRRAMRDYVEQLGAQNAHLHVRYDNAPAIAVYRSLRYAPRSPDAAYAFPAYTREP
jgi:ribosomal protein S18 acetylase RimI-like enzyme